MKILHSADWHLGAYIGPQCDDSYLRMENTIQCLQALLLTASKESPDIILVCGDVFHAAKVWNERNNIEVKVAADYLRQLEKIAPTVVLYGTPNHDNMTSFDLLSDLTVNRSIWFIMSPEIKRIGTKSGLIQIAGLPGFDKGHFRAQFPGLSAEEENRVFTEQLSLIVQGLSAQVDPSIPSVLMAHHTVVGCELDNGQHVFQANEVVLDAVALDNSAFDLVCLGHIHKAQRVDSVYKPVFYAGGLDAFTFNDEGHKKGFWIHDMGTFQSPITYDHTFVETPAMEFLTEYWDMTCFDLYKMGGFDERAKNQYGNKVVRVLYTCDAETEKALDKKKLERDLYAAGAYYVSEIRPEKVTAAVNRERMHEKLTVWDCLRRYLTEKKVDNMADILMTADDIVSTAEANSPVGTSSGLFLPAEIKVKNYRSYAEEKLSFEDIFFAMVNGKNGAGKSSLFMDAITDCLYEETREGELSGWIRNGEKSGSISFTFRLGDDTWRVTRTRQRSGKATLALAKWEIYAYKETGEGWDDHSCERLNDTQRKIIDLLGMDCDTFQSCVLIMQDRYGKFMEASKEDRMAVLASLLGLGIYDELEKLAAKQMTEVNRAVRTIKADIEKLETEVAAEEDLRTEGAQVEVQLACANDDLKAAREELAGYQAQLVAIEGYLREIGALEWDVKQKTNAHAEKKNKKADLENRVTETESFLLNEQNILDRCAELDSTRLEIAALDGKLKLLEDKRLQCGRVNRELIAAQGQRRDIESRLAGIENRLKEKESLEAFVSSNTSEADLEQQELNAKQYTEANNEALRLQVEKSDTERSKKSELREMEQRLEVLKGKTAMLKDANCIDIEKATCRFLKDAIEAKNEVEELETKLIAKRIAVEIDIEKATKKLQEALNKRNSIRYYQFEHDEVIQAVKRFRDAKDRLTKLAADVATADALSIQDLELESRVTEIGKNIDEVVFEIDALCRETGKHAELKTRINSLLQYENLKMQLPKAKQFVESSREQIEQLTADLAGLQAEIDKGNGRLEEMHLLTVNKGSVTANKISKEQEIRTFENKISTYNQQIGTINAKLEVIVGQKAHLQDKKLELQQSAKQAAHLQVLVEAFSQDGIPYQIIRDIVPELEASANEILGQMTGGRMRLEFRMVKINKNNKNVEKPTLDIKIYGLEAMEIDYKSLSGGQKARVALALIFSLSMLKASRVGMQLGFLFLDEPARGLDTEGVEAFCEALEEIHKMFECMKIVVISHDENMKMAFPQQLYVDIGEDGSKVRRAA